MPAVGRLWPSEDDGDDGDAGDGDGDEYEDGGQDTQVVAQGGQ